MYEYNFSKTKLAQLKKIVLGKYMYEYSLKLSAALLDKYVYEYNFSKNRT